MAYSSDSNDDGAVLSNQPRDVESEADSESPNVVVPHESTIERLPTPGSLGIERQGTTFEELAQLALNHHPGLAAARSRIAEEKGTWLQVGLRPNPVLSYAGQEIGNDGDWGQHGIYLQRKFIQGNKLNLNRSVASHDIERARREYSAMEARILNDVRDAFYQALIAQIRRDVSGKLQSLVTEGVRTAEQLLDAGELTRIDMLQSKTEENLVRLASETAIAREVCAKRELAATIGHPEQTVGPLVGDALAGLPRHEWHDVRERLIECPQLAIQLARIDKARCELARARAKQIPDFNVQAGVLFDDSTNNTAGSISVSRPILLHDRNQGNIRRAAAELTTAERELERTMLRLEKNLAVVFQGYQVGRLRVESYAGDILPTSRETIELVTRGFQAGEVDYLTLLTTQRTYIRTYLEFLDALQDSWGASIRIEGCLMSGSLPPSN